MNKLEEIEWSLCSDPLWLTGLKAPTNKLKPYDQNKWLFQLYFLTVDSLTTKLGLMILHRKPECPVKKKNWTTAFKVKVTAKGQNINACPDDIF